MPKSNKLDKLVETDDRISSYEFDHDETHWLHLVYPFECNGLASIHEDTVKECTDLVASIEQGEVQTDLAPAIRELHRIYRRMKHLFPIDMPTPVITIQGEGRRKSYGWFTPEKWDAGHELNVTPEYLRRDVTELGHTVLREMVHLFCHISGIQDTSRSGLYHNSDFKEQAEMVGLSIPEQDPKVGWAHTVLTKKSRSLINRIKINPKRFKCARVPKPVKEKKERETKMKKWSCECTNVRCATDLAATCRSCEKDFELQD